jgi:hypothetical protein
MDKNKNNKSKEYRLKLKYKKQRGQLCTFLVGERKKGNKNNHQRQIVHNPSSCATLGENKCSGTSIV